MENAEKDIMQRRPRSAKAGIFAGGMGGDIAYQGLMVSVLVLASYFIGHFMESGGDPGKRPEPRRHDHFSVPSPCPWRKFSTA